MDSVRGSSANMNSFPILEDSQSSSIINTEEIALGTLPTIIACFAAVFAASLLLGVPCAALALGVVCGVAGICSALGLAVLWGTLLNVCLISALSIFGGAILIGGTVVSCVELQNKEKF